MVNTHHFRHQRDIAMFSSVVASILPILPARFVRLFSKKYIAGETLDQAMTVSAALQRDGLRVTIDILGESNREPEIAERYRCQYLEIFDQLKTHGIAGNCSLKPTMFGILQDSENCYRQIRTIVQKAWETNSFVRLDMEDSRCTDPEIDLFLRLHQEFPEHIGIVLQSCLRRSYSDLMSLTEKAGRPESINIRICKGIYNEPPHIAYPDNREINRQYLIMLDHMLKNGLYAAIATHDITLIASALERIHHLGIKPDRYEFQMLLGVLPGLGYRLVQDGHPLRIYVPYGPDWLSYSIRRLKENPKMMSHILKSVIPFV